MSSLFDEHPMINDALLPAQFAALFRVRELSGEQRMYLAMIEDALRCYQRKVGIMTANINGYGPPSARSERARNEAIRWIDGTGRPHVSFHYACEAIGIEPQALRDRLRNDPNKINLTHSARRRISRVNYRLSPKRSRVRNAG